MPNTASARPARLSNVLSVFLRGDPVAVVGILLSVALSLVLDVTNAASGAESLLAGLAGATLSLVLDSIVRSERRFQLRSVMDAAPWFSEAIYPIAESTREIVKQYPGSLLVSEVQYRYEQLREDLAELQRGRIERDGSDYHYLIEPAIHAQHRMEAVTNIVPESGNLAWWSDDIGRHYWAKNVEAMARGVHITRIFTYVEMTPELDELIRIQRAAGVDAIPLHRSKIVESLQMNFVVWDLKCAWEARLNARGSIIANIFTVNQHDISRLRNAFQRLSMAAARGA